MNNRMQEENLKDEKLTLIIASEIGNTLKVQSFIEHFTEQFNVSKSLFGRIVVTVSEAVNNAITHGNNNDTSQLVTIQAHREKDSLLVSVEDNGKGFNYEHIPDPTNLQNIGKVTGRGLYLMKTLSDSLMFENKGAKVIMSFKLQEDE